MLFFGMGMNAAQQLRVIQKIRAAGVQDIAGYVKAGGAEPVPRTLLIVDEFQEFFIEDDTLAQTAALLLDRLVRQGRAFGVHVLLGSQTLGGAYSISRSTLGQMVVRIALECNEADSYLIMDDNNAAPRLLSRPGEAIYNDAAGMVDGLHADQFLDELERRQPFLGGPGDEVLEVLGEPGESQPGELFDPSGRLKPELAALAPRKGETPVVLGEQLLHHAAQHVEALEPVFAILRAVGYGSQWESR